MPEEETIYPPDTPAEEALGAASDAEFPLETDPGTDGDDQEAKVVPIRPEPEEDDGA